MVLEHDGHLIDEVRSLLKYGRENAIRGKVIAARFGMKDDRYIRQIIRRLIASGIPIASSLTEPMGFYIASSRSEALNYATVTTARIREDASRLRDFKKAATDHLKAPEQMRMAL